MVEAVAMPERPVRVVSRGYEPVRVHPARPVCLVRELAPTLATAATVVTQRARTHLLAQATVVVAGLRREMVVTVVMVAMRQR